MMIPMMHGGLALEQDAHKYTDPIDGIVVLKIQRGGEVLTQTRLWTHSTVDLP